MADIDIIQKEIQELEALWQSIIAKNWTEAIKFLLSAVDDLVTYIEQFDKLTGAEKKALVLSAVDYFYDFVVTPLLPFYLKLFAGKINDLVLFVAGIIIDFIVSKYNEGSWIVATAGHKWGKKSHGGNCC